MHYLILLLSFLSSSAFADDLILPVRGVYDGDTIRSIVLLPYPLNNISVRIKGIDTPEINGDCETEKIKAIAAREAIKTMIGTNKTIIVRNFKWDKYGARVLGDVYINDKNVAEELIKAGHGYPYNGGRRRNWCN